MAEPRSYSHLEIQRYLQHKMSPQEMHEFERALMDDPFLADALEGFTASDASLAEEHLATLENSLTNKGQPAKVIQLSLPKKSWWKVAAVVLVVVLAGAVTYGIINNNAPRRNDIAATTSTPPVTNRDSVRPPATPLAEIETTPAAHLSNEDGAKPAPVIRRSAPAALALAQRSKQEDRMAGDTVKEHPELMDATDPSVARSDHAAAVTPQRAGEQIVVGYGSAKKTSSTATALGFRSNAQNELKGRVVGQSGAPLSYTDIAAAKNAISAAPDAKGSFSVKSTDSFDVNVTSPGFAARQKSGQVKTNNKISKDDEMTLAETVVTALSKKGRRNGVTIDSAAVAAEPAGGWKNFNEYFNQHLDSLIAPGSNDDFDEDLVLEFSVDNQGRPSGITTSVETNKKIADKAKEILSNGPRWKSSQKDKKVKLVIAF